MRHGLQIPAQFAELGKAGVAEGPHGPGVFSSEAVQGGVPVQEEVRGGEREAAHGAGQRDPA